jgi:hypothetical protein
VSFGPLQLRRLRPKPPSRCKPDVKKRSQLLLATESGVAAMEGLFVLVQEDSGLLEVTRHSASCFPRGWYLNQNGSCLLVELNKILCCAIKSKIIAAQRFFL